MENKNKSVYPQIGSISNNDNQLTEVFSDENNSGLNKREYFAGLFIQGILSAQTEMRSNGLQNDHFGGAVESIVSEAVEIADEFLKQLEITKI